VPAPTDEALQAVLHKIILRMMTLLTRRGALVQEQGATTMADNDADSDDARTLRLLQVAACNYRVAVGPRAGHKVLRVQGAMPREASCKQKLCANSGKVSTCTPPCAAQPTTVRRWRWYGRLPPLNDAMADRDSREGG
jgi:hypothetical protein